MSAKQVEASPDPKKTKLKEKTQRGRGIRKTGTREKQSASVCTQASRHGLAKEDHRYKIREGMGLRYKEEIRRIQQVSKKTIPVFGRVGRAASFMVEGPANKREMTRKDHCIQHPFPI